MIKRTKTVAPEKITCLADFLLLVESLGLNVLDHKKSSSRYSSGAKTSQEHWIYAQWVSGGTGGGSCWDNGDEDRHYAISGEPPQELVDLDKILEAVAPNISFIQYRVLERTCVETSSYSEDEYYGNCTNYGVKECCLEKLYVALVERKIL